MESKINSTTKLPGTAQNTDFRALRNQYYAGKQFIDAYHTTDPTRSEEPFRLPSLAVGTSGRTVAETVAGTLGIRFEQYKPMIQFAVAVNTIVHNCGVEAMDVIFDPANPQSVKSVKQLADTSDVRQRYRINAVIAGESSTIRPQGSDPVFDTIAFSEVPSRLARARGVLGKLADRTDGIKDPTVPKELKRLLRFTLDAANQLENLVKGKATSASAMGRLGKASVFPILQSRSVTGKDVGYGRQALRLTIKNVWDYPEMCHRKLVPTDAGKAKVLQELAVIKSAVKRILG